MVTTTATFVLLFFASYTWAQGTIPFDCGYPKPSCSSGIIDTKGTFTLDCGWSVVGTTGTISVWQDGSVRTTQTVTIGSGTFAGHIGGLTSGGTYNVTFEITVIDRCLNTVTIRTDPARVMAP